MARIVNIIKIDPDGKTAIVEVIDSDFSWRGSTGINTEGIGELHKAITKEKATADAKVVDEHETLAIEIVAELARLDGVNNG